MKSFKSTFSYNVHPFICDTIDDRFPISEIILTEKAAGELALFEMKEDHALQILHKGSSMIEFWKLMPESKYPNLKKGVCHLFWIFSTKYFCESLYSAMKFMKLKYRSLLTNQHLTEFLF